MARKRMAKAPIRSSKLLMSCPTGDIVDDDSSYSQAHFSFLDLPPEIRVRIYNLALGGQEIFVDYPWGQWNSTGENRRYQLWSCATDWTPDEVARIYKTQGAAGQLSPETLTLLTEYDNSGAREHEERVRPNLPLSLLQTCKQIHWEAALVPFQQNTFVICAKAACDFGAFCARLIAEQRRAIRSIRLIDCVWYCDALSKRFAALCPRVTDLTISTQSAGFMTAEGPVLEIMHTLSELQRWPLKSVRVLVVPDERVYVGSNLEEQRARYRYSKREIRTMLDKVESIEKMLLQDWNEAAYQRRIAEEKEICAAEYATSLTAKMKARNQRAEARGLRPRI